MSSLLIFLSSTLVLISPFIYARAILKGEAKPHRTTRFVLFIIAALSTATLFANGNTVAVWLAGANLVQGAIILGLSLKYGMGGWAKIDLACLAIALIGIIAWQTTKNPLIGLYCSILADFTGMVPTLIKTYRLPKTEIATFFALDIFAALFSTLATHQWTMEQLAYPLYIGLINAIMVTLILWPRPKTVPVSNDHNVQ
ncbi:hypothetical protein KBD61_01260 [Patescibacteria group bacterium]|nr:hypothetical protein [Patescibacteria group bacterium]MBP9709637.1 hypothetical protein [Patescibacteria group bacterium]